MSGQPPKRAIDPVFDQPGVGFVFLPAGKKFPPIEEGWQNKSHSFGEAQRHVSTGGNVGVMAGNGYIGLDQDDREAFAGLELPHTTTWETRPGRLGMWFRCADVVEGLVAIGRKADQAQLFLKKDGVPVGELKLGRSYQVIPPSWKPLDDGSRGDYKLIDAVPPAEVSLIELLEDLRAMGIAFTENPQKSRLDENVEKMAASRRSAANGRLDRAAKAKQLFNDALFRGEAGNRNSTGFWLACQLRDLGLDATEAADYMVRYARGVPKGDHPYTESDALESLRQAYTQPARDPPASEEKRQAEAETRAAGRLLVGLPERLKENPIAIKEPGVIEALARLKNDDPLGFDVLTKKLANIGVRRVTIEGVVKSTSMKKTARTTSRRRWTMSPTRTR